MLRLALRALEYRMVTWSSWRSKAIDRIVSRLEGR